jgi:hypothetical protein
LRPATGISWCPSVSWPWVYRGKDLFEVLMELMRDQFVLVVEVT